MKKLFIFLFVAGWQIAYPQAYIKLSVGYGVPSSSQKMGTNSSFIYDRKTNPETGFLEPEYRTREEDVYGSYGSGYMVTGSFGYMFTQHLGVDLGLRYQHGKSYKTLDAQEDIIDGVVVEYSRYHNSSYGRSIMATPSLVLTTGDGMFSPYLMAGPVFGKTTVWTETENYELSDEMATESSEIRHEKASGGISIGISGTAGVRFRLTERVNLFGEVSFTGVNYYPKESEITKYTVNGEDKLSTLSVRDKKSVFVKRLTSQTGDPAKSSDDPTEALRYSTPFSSVGFNVGVRVSMGG
jgi:hypothetical protein